MRKPQQFQHPTSGGPRISLLVSYNFHLKLLVLRIRPAYVNIRRIARVHSHARRGNGWLDPCSIRIPFSGKTPAYRCTATRTKPITTGTQILLWPKRRSRSRDGQKNLDLPLLIWPTHHSAHLFLVFPNCSCRDVIPQSSPTRLSAIESLQFFLSFVGPMACHIRGQFTHRFGLLCFIGVGVGCSTHADPHG